jgi:hypothetical protein
MKLLAKLNTVKGVDPIKRIKQGQGKTALKNAFEITPDSRNKGAFKLHQNFR